jgi:hypothetical protein
MAQLRIVVTRRERGRWPLLFRTLQHSAAEINATQPPRHYDESAAGIRLQPELNIYKTRHAMLSCRIFLQGYCPMSSPGSSAGAATVCAAPEETDQARRRRSRSPMRARVFALGREAHRATQRRRWCPVEPLTATPVNPCPPASALCTRLTSGRRVLSWLCREAADRKGSCFLVAIFAPRPLA